MKKFFVLLVLCLIFQEKWLHSQQQFRLYGVHQGLSHSVVNTIFQGPKGFIWAGTAIGLSRFDGLQFIANPTLDSLPADFVSTSFTDANGDIWLGHNDGSLTFFDGENFKIVSPSEQTRSRVVGIAEDKSGRIFAATLGHGLILVESDSLVQITQDEGLLNNFCYSLAFDNDGNAWVSHRLGLSRINSNNLRVRTFGRDVGIEGDGNFNSILNTPKGELFVGTTQGLVIFNHLKAKELPPPKTNITAVYISDQLVDHSKPINLPPGAYKLRIEFTGISFSNPEKVRYQYKLVGHDLDWGSVTSNNWALYPRIEDGNYRFVLNAFNADGVATEEPVELIISVRKPVWKQTWFHALLLIIAVIGVILIVKIREKAHKQKEKYLEEELGRRAGELKQKNTELHKKNKDITDSINYAKRIQSSILPPIHKIEIWFPGSFVFYSPRDIVSGDFYWFEIVNDSKFLIVCADSTGHGVPGAFMSIIGATLIKDIAMRFNVNSPSEILTMLDYEVAAMLNLPEVAEGVNSSDGMDLTVCEIDINTNYLRFASAMRPIMLYHKKELIYIKGSRNAIGGQNTNVKEFETQGYQLEKGDLIYMFTDGFSDQFGGPFGKKYKIVRLKNLLADICTMPVEKQELMIVNEFNSWKGDQEQVDDVLFMCIKI